MKVLFVTPSETGSGEAITAAHIADNLTQRGNKVRFLASAHTARFLRGQSVDSVGMLTRDAEQNRRLWDHALRGFRPDVVVFADYPLLFFSTGTPPLADERWVLSLETLQTALVTLDHLGYAQRPTSLPFGPAHLGLHYETLPALPAAMRILLPCPVQEPSEVPGRKGAPFRPWALPLRLSDHLRWEIRRRYVSRDDFLIVHSVPAWAWRLADAARLPYYTFLPRLLEHYLADLPRSVTVISVNNGRLLPAPEHPRVRILNLEPLPREEYEALMLVADLFITENMVSVSL
ncbi:MAG: DUF6365 family protein, partial [Armatimonadota bacterium]